MKQRVGLIEEGEAFRKLSASSRSFHIAMSIAFLVTAFAGFAPTYYLRGLTHHATAIPSTLVHVHALAFTSWLLLLFTQSALVAAHRVDLHRRLGIGGAILAAVMVPLGAMMAIDAAQRAVAKPGLEPLVFLIFPLGQMLMFAVFIGAALWKRRRPELHRRLILLATATLMAPAIARLPFVGTRPAVSLALSALFVVAGIVHDWRSRGRVHRVYLWGGLVLLLSGPARVVLGHTHAWQAFARLLVG